MKNKVCFFSKAYQAIPALVVVQKELGGIFVCGRKNTNDYFRKTYPLLQNKKLNSRFKILNDGHRALCNASIIVTGSPYRKQLVPYSARKVMVFHGTYMELTGKVLEQLRLFHHLFLIGPRMEKALLRYQGEHTFRYLQTGFIPFADFPEKTDGKKHQMLVDCGLDDSLKTIVYCPTSRKVGTWDQCVEALIKQIPEDYNLVLRPHPRQEMNMRRYERSSMRKIRTLVKNRKNTVLDLVGSPLPDFLMAADLLISDANSPAEESLFYDTPQLLTGVGGASYKSNERTLESGGMREKEIQDCLRIFNCGPVYAEEGYGNWGEAVQDALLGKNEFSGERESCFKFIFGRKDRDAGRRVADILRREYL